MSLKRKRVVVSLETKLNAIKRLDKGESIKKVAAELGVGEVTVGDWRRKRKEIEQWVNQSVSGGSDLGRKTMKKGDHEQTSEALYLWFSQLRGMGSPISGPILQAKALEFHRKFKDGEDNFCASEGWMDTWKKKYGIRQLNICGEKLSADSSEIESFYSKLKNMILNYGLTSDQIFNCDETGLNYKMLPSKTLAAKNEATAPGYKKSKERVTIMNCCNASGSLKLRPLLIGKAKNPRAFKNVQVNCLPTIYTNQRNAWMDCAIFKTWFLKDFVPVVEAFLKQKNLPPKALLLLDNARSHPDANELVSGEIRAVFLPSNVTSLIQPLDQGVLEAMKRNYRRRLLQVLLAKLDEGLTVTDALKKITVKDVAYWIASAWDDVKVSTIQKSWKNIFQINNRSKDTQKETDDCVVELANLANHLPVEQPIINEDVINWINGDEEMELSDDAIADLIVNKNNYEGDDDEDTDDATPKISHSEGLKLLEGALAYVEQQEESTPFDVLHFQRWRNIAAAKRDTKLTQKTIKDFFKH